MGIRQPWSRTWEGCVPSTSGPERKASPCSGCLSCLLPLAEWSHVLLLRGRSRKSGRPYNPRAQREPQHLNLAAGGEKLRCLTGLHLSTLLLNNLKAANSGKAGYLPLVFVSKVVLIFQSMCTIQEMGISYVLDNSSTNIRGEALWLLSVWGSQAAGTKILAWLRLAPVA